MFFDGWEGIWRTALIGTLAYICLVVLLRVSGKRTLSKMNAFDFVVTVALGSTLASILLSKDVPLAQGLTALLLLVLLQFGVAWTAVRSKRFSGLVKSQPVMLLYRGRYLHGVMNRERVTEEEVSAAVRSQGMADIAAALAVVLETDGSFPYCETTKRSLLPHSMLSRITHRLTRAELLAMQTAVGKGRNRDGRR